jgi:hypothetical protein
MAKLPQQRTVRDLRIAARDGDRVAIRTLLRRYNFVALARTVRRGKPIPPATKRMVGALVAGTGTRDELGPWEAINKRTGEIENDLQLDPVIFKE